MNQFILNENFDAGGFVVVERKKGHSNPMILSAHFFPSLNLLREYVSRVDFFVSFFENVKMLIFGAINGSL